MARHGETFRKFEVDAREDGKISRFGRLHEAHSGDESKFGNWRRLGAPGGPLEGRSVAVDARNENLPAGYVFLGQFLAHDMTYDPTSLYEQEVDQPTTWNFRTPRLDLDSVYGSGPRIDTHLYDSESSELFLLRPDGRDDVPRTVRNVAIIADSRNDQTVFISQLHLAFLRLHNAVVGYLRAIPELEGLPSPTMLKAARTLVRWHYHWVILNDYLRRVCLANDVVRTANRLWHSGARFYGTAKNEPFIPIEFSLAAFRFGHSQVSEQYRTRQGDPPQSLLDALSVSFNYSRPDWSLFFGDAFHIQYSNKIGRRIEPFLFRLPARAVPANLHGDGPFSLPLLTLGKGMRWKLPSGTDLAAARLNDETVLRPDEIWEGEGFAEFRNAEPPLWYYILREAEVQPGGHPNDRGCRLGPLGSNIVWTVLVDLIAASGSYGQDWRPRFRRVRNSAGAERVDFGIPTLLEIASHPRLFDLDPDSTLRDLAPVIDARPDAPLDGLGGRPPFTPDGAPLCD